MSAAVRLPAVDTPAPAVGVQLLDVLAGRGTVAATHRSVTAGGQRRESVR
ncbi:hypothetical protein [Micromonospora sp. LOL_023]